MASPALRVNRFESALDLRKHVLLDFEHRHEWLTWRSWLGERGMTTAMARGVLRFNQYDQAIQAAAAGHGVALGRLELVDDLLKRGRLQVPPGAPESRNNYGYWLVQASPSPRAEVLRVREWLVGSQDTGVQIG